jgi:hypothetical protein
VRGRNRAKTTETPGVAGHIGETSHVRDPPLRAPATAVTLVRERPVSNSTSNIVFQGGISNISINWMRMGMR